MTAEFPVPRQLPRDVTNFVNRDAQLATLDELLEVASSSNSQGFAFATIAGSPGVGKTALAVHWAHRVRDKFSDGELYVDLRGHELTRASLDEALDGCIRALGVSPEQIPPGTDARSALLRSALMGRRVLLILDNVKSAADTRLFLPGSSGCMVIVTSRRSLSGLAARDGARRVTLEALSDQESLALLAQIIGDERVLVDEDSAGRLANLCCNLPLALRIVAERVAGQFDRSLIDFVNEIASERARLDEFSSEGDEDSDIRAVFSSSYRELDLQEARTFRLMSLHPGRSFSIQAASAILDEDDYSTRRRLESLAAAHLIQPQSLGRYTFHDLLREYAFERACEDEPAEGRVAAQRRAFSWYMRSLGIACRTVLPNFHAFDLDDAERYSSPVSFSGPEPAWEWFEVERANLVQATYDSMRLGHSDIAWRLPAVMYPLLELHQHWQQWLEIQQIGIAAARKAGSTYGESCNYLGLGDVQWLLQRREEALTSYDSALRLGRQCRDGWLEGFSLRQMGVVLVELGRDGEAVEMLRAARRVFTRSGERRGEGMTLLSLAAVDRSVGRWESARTHAEGALEILSATADAWSTAWARCAVGQALLDLGEAALAADQYQEACRAFRLVGDRRNEGRALLGVGIAAQRMGRTEDARSILSQVDLIINDLKDEALVAEIREMMDQLN